MSGSSSTTTGATLRGGVAETLIGTDGADTLTGYAGSDFIDGGAGRDVVDYSAERVAGGLGPVSVDLLRGYATDSFGTVDRVVNIENVVATLGNDYVEGSTDANRVDGLAGNDIVWAWGGNDTIDGGTGDDTLAGGEGADSVVGGAGADWVWAGDGNDPTFPN